MKPVKKTGTSVSPVSAKDFFSSELKAVLEKRRMEANQDAFDYIVELLIRSIDSQNFFSQSPDGKPVDHFLVGLYAEYLTGAPEAKKNALRRLGDVCLMVTGFFPDSLNRKLVDLEYYSGMGGAAYGELSRWQAEKPVFQELSVKFRSFSDVLAEMSERTGLHSNADILRIYERWVQSGSERLKELLAERGIETPIRLDIKTRH